MKQRNRSVDILRLTAAFFVICLHNFSGSGVWAGDEISAVSRFAVPLFFLFSGYFAAGFTWQRKLRQAGKIFLLAVISNLGYLALDLSRQQAGFLMRMRFHELFTPEAVKNLLLYNASPVSGHLWFLGALLYILLLDLLLTALERRLPQGRAVMWGLSGVLFFGGLLLYHVLTRDPAVDFPLYAYRNFLFFGLPLYLAGRLIRGSGFAKKPLPTPLYPVLILGFCGLSVLEYRLFGVWEVYLGSLLLAFLLLHLALCHPLSQGGRLSALLSWLGKNTALTIYIVHIYVLDRLRGLYWERLPWQYEPGIYHLIPIGTFLLSLLIGVILAGIWMGLRKAAAWAAGRLRRGEEKTVN